MLRKFDYGIIIASDSRSKGEKQDACIEAVKKSLGDGFTCVYEKIVCDDLEVIREELLHMSDILALPLLLTSGGTGFSPRDNTPEATMALLERPTPGLSEAIRLIALEKTPYGMLSRAVSGIRGKSLIINLPGSPKAVQESLEGIREPLRHGLEILLGLLGEHE